MKNLIIVGASGHAAEIVDYIEYINYNSINLKYNIIEIPNMSITKRKDFVINTIKSYV